MFETRVLLKGGILTHYGIGNVGFLHDTLSVFIIHA